MDIRCPSRQGSHVVPSIPHGKAGTLPVVQLALVVYFPRGNGRWPTDTCSASMVRFRSNSRSAPWPLQARDARKACCRSGWMAKWWRGLPGLRQVNTPPVGSAGGISVFHPKRRTVFRTVLALVVEPGRGDVGVAQPLLDLGDIGIMRERVGRRRGPQRMHAEALHRRVDAHRLAVARRYPGRLRSDSAACSAYRWCYSAPGETAVPGPGARRSSGRG